MSAAATWVVGLAMLTDSFGDDKLAFAVGMTNASYYFGYFMGPILSGILQKWSLSLPFYLSLGLVCIDLLGRLLIIPPKPKPRRDGQKSLSLFRLFRNPSVMMVSLAVLFSTASFSVVEMMLPDFVDTQFKLGPLATSVLTISFVLPTMVISIFLQNV